MTDFKSSDLIFSEIPPVEWVDGYPTGNGRLGAMVVAYPDDERIGLNHDMLWRKEPIRRMMGTAKDLPEIRRLCAEGKWDDAHELLLQTMPFTGRTLYLNPFVPAGDLIIHMEKGADAADTPAEKYKRRLDLSEAIATAEYERDGVKYTRETFVPWNEGVILTKLTASKPGALAAEIELSRIADPDCTVTGETGVGTVKMKVIFDEGFGYSVVSRVVTSSGTVAEGRGEYLPTGDTPAKDRRDVVEYKFRPVYDTRQRRGVSTRFEGADTAYVITAISVDGEDAAGPDAYCERLISQVAERLAGPDGEREYTRIRMDHIADHARYYAGVTFRLGGADADRGISQDDLLKRVEPEGYYSNVLYEKIFNMGRYLAILSGRPAKPGQPHKAPINLQGIWNEDRKPAWESDYHLDLNVEMYYWPLHNVGLSELMIPLVDLIEKLSPQMRETAKDLYGCRGIVAFLMDYYSVGNADNIAWGWTGGLSWIMQIANKYWKYTGDIEFLRTRIYPILKEIVLFYEDRMTEFEPGKLAVFPGGSPEINIKGRKHWNCLSSPSTIELENIRDAYRNLIEASETLGTDELDRARWQATLDKVPLPVISPDGVLQEWYEPHEQADRAHRHRSHLIGLLTSDRITEEDTPEYFKAAELALNDRIEHDRQDKVFSFTSAMDSQMYSRLYNKKKAYENLSNLLKYNAMGNMLFAVCDWRDRGFGLGWFKGRRVFQVEGLICTVASISEMIFQDGNGLIRLLPALPDAWPEGSMQGLKSITGMTVNVKWKDGKLQSATFRASRHGVQRVRIFTRSLYEMTLDTDGQATAFKSIDRVKGILEFEFKKGREYTLTAR